MVACDRSSGSQKYFYVGDYRYNALREGDRSKPKPESEWIIVKDHHPAIISREQFARVQAILKQISGTEKIWLLLRPGNVFISLAVCCSVETAENH